MPSRKRFVLVLVSHGRGSFKRSQSLFDAGHEKFFTFIEVSDDCTVLYFPYPKQGKYGQFCVVEGFNYCD